MRAVVHARFAGVREVSTAELAAWLADPDRAAPLLLDVRTAREYAVSHLPDAIRVEPGSDPAPLLASLPADRPLVTYCAVGYRSAVFAEALAARGRGDVRNLSGSIFAWANEGRPLVDAHGPARLVHPYDRFWGLLLAPDRRADVV